MFPDDGHIRTETCSLTHNKYDVLDVSCFIILILNLNTSGCLQSNFMCGVGKGENAKIYNILLWDVMM